MRKVLKWIGIVFGGLIGLVLIAALGAGIYGQLNFKRTLQRATYPIVANTSSEGIARGEYLVKNVVACGDCHSDDPLNPDYSGHYENVNQGPIAMVFAAPNLTSDMETGLGSWTDSEIARAIREGVDKEGRELIIMPSTNYRNISDDDIAAIIGYLRSIPQVKKAIPDLDANFIGKSMIAFGLVPKGVTLPLDRPIPSPEKGSIEYGAYLVAIGSCVDCHGANLDGTGGTMGPLAPMGPNITAVGRVGRWTEEEFVKAIQTGETPEGRSLSEAMPWKVYGNMTDDDLASIYRYLMTLTGASASK